MKKIFSLSNIMIVLYLVLTVTFIISFFKDARFLEICNYFYGGLNALTAITLLITFITDLKNK